MLKLMKKTYIFNKLLETFCQVIIISNFSQDNNKSVEPNILSFYSKTISDVTFTWETKTFSISPKFDWIFWFFKNIHG